MTFTQAIITALATILVAVLGYFGTRFAVRSANRVNRERLDADWNASYRAAAEEHLGWDYMIIGRLQRVEQLNGINESIPPPPPLFPKPPKEVN